MAFVISNNHLQTNLTIQHSSCPIQSNRIAPEGPVIFHRQDVGPTGINIPPLYLAGPCISVTPSSVGQNYTLPTASQILQVFGRNLESGIPRFGPGTIMELQVINRGTYTCALVSNPTGGDGTAVLCYTGAYGLGTGVVPLAGYPTHVYLEWIQVYGGPNGATGYYSIYA